MVLRKAEATSGHPFIPGKDAWGVPAGTPVPVKCLAFDGADRMHRAPAAAASDAGDVLHIPVPASEFRHAGA